MRISKILMAALLLAALAMPAAAPAAAFSDVADPGLSGKIDLMAALGIFSGMPDGTFRPIEMLNRAIWHLLAYDFSHINQEKYMTKVIYKYD